MQPKNSIHHNDCKSDLFSQNIQWDILKDLVNEGWEFGGHASINSKTNIDNFLYAKYLIESKLESTIFGLRHHYWSIDWLKQHLTFRKHANAGFRYDTSIAWEDSSGFRAGTCLPYNPFGPIRDKPINLFELPTCLMDGHITHVFEGHKNQLTASKNIINSVKDCGGVAVLDWHTESFCNKYVYSGDLTSLEQILENYVGNSDIWFTTPWEIIKW